MSGGQRLVLIEIFNVLNISDFFHLYIMVKVLCKSGELNEQPDGLHVYRLRNTVQLYK